MRATSYKNPNLQLDPKKMETYKLLLKNHRAKILNKIFSLNDEYASTSIKYKKKSIADEIDILELELEKVNFHLTTYFYDRDVMMDNIFSQKEEISEIEYLLNTKKIPFYYNAKLINKKLDLSNYINEALLNKSFLDPVVQSHYQPQQVIAEPQIIEVEKYVEIPTLIGVDRIVEVPKIVEVGNNNEIVPSITSEQIASTVNDEINKFAQDLYKTIDNTNELINQKFMDTSTEINSLKENIANSNGQVQIIKETEPIYIETPVLIKEPYYENDDQEYEEEPEEQINESDYYQEEEPYYYTDAQRTDNMQEVITEEYYPADNAYDQQMQYGPMDYNQQMPYSQMDYNQEMPYGPIDYNQQMNYDYQMQYDPNQQYYNNIVDPPIMDAVPYENAMPEYQQPITQTQVVEEVTPIQEQVANNQPIITKEVSTDVHDEYEEDDYFDDDDDFDSGFE